ncbi:RCC1 domain-containing protein [Anaeromyxobacter oryzae]|uniref:Regulator of chromosome condensation RCC1 n=1 Tax=Anaeromyxobacter oryzae TaxID=2918170 RepID=A0ABM7WV87_9BACT|nr:hypothetical protein [Anaeromyxobacter oryzae]BDG03388.1 hypothetical protein AMOR_23840 [Anaeromyxobacter oryzae]
MASPGRRPLVLLAGAALVAGAGCGDTLVDHRNTALRDQGQGVSCTDPRELVCKVDGLDACVPESVTHCGVGCEDCTATVTPPAGGQVDCLAPAGGHGACGFSCTGGLLRTAAACEGAIALAAGAAHTCAVTGGGALLCWGQDDQGQVTGAASAAPVLAPHVVFASGVTAVAAGKAHTCAVVSGQIRCLGRNAEGQAPTTRAGSAVALAAGDRHTCALSAAGAVTCWGASALGQTGGGTPIAAGANALAAGADHTCALASGAVSCWGTNASAEIGTGSAGGSYSTPQTPLGLGAGVVALGAGAHHACAATSARTLLCWGGTVAGTIPGFGTAQATPVAPQKAGGGGGALVSFDVGMLAGGRAHTCLERPGESVKCFGADNSAGQLGIGLAGELADAGTPLPAPGATSVFAIGGDHGCVVDGAGAVSCWGSNASGQLGDGTQTTPPVGTRVSVSGR